MKDLVPKGTGNSRYLKSVSNFLSLYPTYDDFVAALVAGTLPVDLNGINSAGVTQVGTALNKSTLLDDTTAAALELDSSDPTVNEALYALSQKTQPAVLNVTTTKGITVTCTKGSKKLTATADSTGLAVLYPDEFGTWTLSATISGKSLSVPFEIDAIAVFNTTLTTVLEDASWDLISAVSKAGNAASVWSVGDTKTIKVNGTSYTAQIIGFNHDTVTDSSAYGRSKAGITWQLVDCLNTTAQMNSSNSNTTGWTSCLMRTNMSTYLGQLDEDLQKVIVGVNKLTSAGNQSTTINTTSDKLFLLSEIEIFGSVTYSKSGEGSQYSWYSAGNSKIKKVNGSANYWWERSPCGSNATYFCFVNSSGGANSNAASYSFGVSFGFCV